MDLSSTAVDRVVGRDSVTSRGAGSFAHGAVLFLSSNGPTLEPTSVTGAQESSELNMARETWTRGLVDGNEVTLAGWNKEGAMKRQWCGWNENEADTGCQ